MASQSQSDNPAAADSQAQQTGTEEVVNGNGHEDGAGAGAQNNNHHDNTNGEQGAAADPPASPPLPERHTAVAPGPRASRLQELYAQRLKRTLAKLAWGNFAGCYPTVSKKAENVLKQVQGQMVDKLGVKCEKEFENIMIARQVVPKLNDLESLIHDAARRRAEAESSETTHTTTPIPPHLLPPDAILSAHLHPALAAHQSQLNARLQTTQSQNALLYDEVVRQREEIAALLDRLEAVVADVRGANDALRPIADEIAVETREGLAAVEAAGTQKP